LLTECILKLCVAQQNELFGMEKNWGKKPLPPSFIYLKKNPQLYHICMLSVAYSFFPVCSVPFIGVHEVKNRILHDAYYQMVDICISNS